MNGGSNAAASHPAIIDFHNTTNKTKQPQKTKSKKRGGGQGKRNKGLSNRKKGDVWNSQDALMSSNENGQIVHFDENGFIQKILDTQITSPTTESVT